MSYNKNKWKTLEYDGSSIDCLSFLVLEYANKRTSNLRIRYPQEYVNLIHFTNFLPANSSATNRLWHIEHNNFSGVKCLCCDNMVKWHASKGGYVDYCSIECSNSSSTTQKKREATCLERYGVTSYTKTQEFKDLITSEEHLEKLNSEEIIAKRKATCIERYGVDTPFKSSDIQEKKRKTNLERYGYDNPFKSPAIQATIKSINQKKYGADTPFQSEEFQATVRKNNLEKYGAEFPLQLSEVLNKTRESYFERTGYYTPFANPDIKDEIKIIFDEKYGCHPTQAKYSELTLSRLSDREWLYQKHHLDKMTLTEISLDYLEGYDVSSISASMKNLGIEILSRLVSKQERDIRAVFDELDIEYVTGDRSLISPYELDLYIPEFNIAIEYCGIYWHSEMYKESDYHYNKYVMCKNKGIRLITIFEDEWLNRRDTVIRKLKNMLGLSHDVTYARKCTISKVKTEIAREFLDKYHIQGFTGSSIKLGLYEGDNIVGYLGLSLINSDELVYNIDRFVTSKRVTGGFSKLLKHFIRNNNYNEIVTFSDNRWDVGNMYTKTGFDIVKEVPVDYSYVVLNKRIHKFNFRKKHLDKMLGNYDPNLTEHQNCYNNKIYRIYDCGKIKYSLKKP